MKILVTGGSGMIGHSFKNYKDCILVGSKDYDLRHYQSARHMVSRHRPDAIIHLAAKVGGVKANMENNGDFYSDNILINHNVLRCARQYDVKKVVSLMSTCVYPRVEFVNYPLTEEQIHNGPPHDSNFGYAFSKRMLDVQSRGYREQYGCNFITAIPNNLFGENDNFHLEDSHVIPAMIRKVYEAKMNNTDVVLWGDGSPLREFTYSKDLAKILLFLLKNYNEKEPINVGNPHEVSIKNVAKLVAQNMNFKGNIRWDTDKPSGQFRKPSSNKKLLDLGWKNSDYTSFEKSLKKTCNWFIINYPNIRGIT